MDCFNENYTAGDFWEQAFDSIEDTWDTDVTPQHSDPNAFFDANAYDPKADFLPRKDGKQRKSHKKAFVKLIDGRAVRGDHSSLLELATIDKDIKRLKFHSYNRESVSSWIGRGCPAGQSPETPISAILADMSVGKAMTIYSGKLMHLVFAVMYQQADFETYTATIKKSDIAAFLDTEARSVNKAAKALGEMSAVFGSHKIMNGSRAFTSALFSSVIIGRTEIAFTLADGLRKILHAPAYYAYIELAAVRKLTSVYSISLLGQVSFWNSRSHSNINPAINATLSKLADLMNVSPAPGTHVKASRVLSCLNKAFLDINKTYILGYFDVIQNSLKNTAKGIDIYATDRKQNALYMAVPNKGKKHFKLRARDGLFVYPPDFIALARDLNLKLNKATADAVHVSWMMYLEITSGESNDVFPDFVSQSKRARGLLFEKDGVGHLQHKAARDYFKLINGSLHDQARDVIDPSAASPSIDDIECPF